MAVLENLNQADAQLKAIIARQAEELAAMKAKLEAKSNRAITCKVTAPKPDPKTGEMRGSSGAISVYGLGRFPVTLFASQWVKLFAAVPEIKAFMETNRHLLSTKD